MPLELFECCGKLFCECNFKGEPKMEVTVGRVYKHVRTSKLHVVSKVVLLGGEVEMVYYAPIPKDPTKVGRDVLPISDFRKVFEELALPEAGSTWMHHRGNPYAVIAVSNVGVSRNDWLSTLVTYKACGDSRVWTRRLHEFHEKFSFISPPHSVECLYVYQLSALNLQDTPSLRIAHWDYHNALEWSGDSPKVPDASVADCHTRCPACLHGSKNN